MEKKVLTLDIVLAKEIEYMIAQEGMKEGTPLLSERLLAEQFCVQRGTVRRALQILLDKGVIVCKAKRGYFTTPIRVDFNLNAYNSRKAIIERMGKESYVKLLTFEKIFVSSKIAEKTGLEEDSQVFRIMRLRYTGGTPMGLERTHVRCDMAPGITEEDVHNKSLYEALRKKHNIHIARSEEKVTAVYANGLESELLNTSRSKPLMRYEGLVYDKRGILVEYFDDILIKEKVQFISDEVHAGQKKKHIKR